MKRKIALRTTLLIISLTLVTAAWQLRTPQPARSRANSIAPTVSLSGERVLQASPAAADFDGDGDKEIVIGGGDGMLYVIAYNGSSWSVVWSRQTATDFNAQGAPGTCATTATSKIVSAPAIADLDNDGSLEIVVATGSNPSEHFNGGVIAYTFDSAWSFSLVPGWPQPRIDDLGSGVGIRDPDGCWDGFTTSASVGDLDGDGDLEVVSQTLNRRIFAWHHDGTNVASWPIHRDSGDNLLRGGESTPALGDIDGDGLVEVIVGSNSPVWDGSSEPDYSKASVWAINGDSSNVPNWPVETLNNISSSPALGDIDGDGQLEIVIGSGRTTEGGTGQRVYAWNNDGSVVSGWPKTTAGDMTSSPALGDLDGDGDLEIVIGCGKESLPAGCTSLYAWHGNGSSVAGFPVSPPSNNPLSDDPAGLPYPPQIADYDGDGSPEILAVNLYARGPSTVESDGTASYDTSLAALNPVYGPPIVGDVDNDGKLEIVMAGADDGAIQGGVFIMDVNGNASSAMPWPMFMHDARRTGNFNYYEDSIPPQNPTSLTSSSHSTGAWSNDNQVQMNWSGASDDESGLAGYYYLWDNAPTTSVDQSGSWLASSQETLDTPLDDGQDWYFHLRAVDNAGLLATDTLHFGPLHIDTVPPVSQASAPSCAALSANVSWSGSDAGSGIASYDVQVREQGSSAWSTWKSGDTSTSDWYSDSTGAVYQFRSLANDLAGNVETKDSNTFDAQTWLTEYSFAGTVYNAQEQPVFKAQITSTPAIPVDVYTDMQGDFFLCHQDELNNSLSASRYDYGALPAMQDLDGTLSNLEFYLPPSDDALQGSGQFESSSDLDAWDISASVALTDTAHTGLQSVALISNTSAVMSRTLSLPGAQAQTLSLLYRSSSNWSRLTVQDGYQTWHYALTTSNSWSHFGLDLSALQGQTISIGLHLNSPFLEYEWLFVDEISLGTAAPGLYQIYLPLASQLN
jgi:hypothetical protein